MYSFNIYSTYPFYVAIILCLKNLAFYIDIPLSKHYLLVYRPNLLNKSLLASSNPSNFL